MVPNRRTPSRRRPAAVRRAARRAVETLELRRMMSVASLSDLASQEQVVSAIAPVLANTATPAGNSVSLAAHFTDPRVPGTVATFNTTGGEIVVALTDQATPATVSNFLSYLSEYAGTIFHRSANLTTGNGGSPTAPADIIQGGGYAISGGSLNHINVTAPIADEYSTETFGDLQYTLAEAKTSDANSGTSEWYFNAHDNTATLDQPSLTYTAFGSVLSGQSVVDAIAALPTADLNQQLTTVPVTGANAAQVSAGTVAATADNLVYTNAVTSQPGTTYTVSSDNPALVTPTVTNGVLSFAYGAGMTGVADVTVTATNYDKTTASTTFPVTVGGSASTPTAANFTAPAVITGQSVTFNPLAPDTATAAAAFDPSTVTVTTPPAHGTATVDPASGRITYTPAAGYTGADTLQYTVADTAGAVTNAATVSLTAVPTAAIVSVGGTNPSVLNFTQPDGTTASIRIVNAAGTVTFANYDVTVTKGAAGYQVTGPGATVQAITLSDTKRFAFSSLFVTSAKPIAIHDIYNSDAMTTISAPTTTVTGTLGVSGGHSGGVNNVLLGGLNGATVTLVNRILQGTAISVGTVLNSTVNVGSLTTLTVGSWTITDGAAHPFSATSIGRFDVTGTFAVPLTLTGKGYDIITANVNAPTAPWNLSGSVYRANLTNPATTWGLTADGVVQNLKVIGNLSSPIAVAAINQLSTTGNLSGSYIQTSAGFSAKAVQIRSIKVGGSIAGETIFSAGNVGTISAAAVTNSHVYAGVNLTVAQNGVLPTTTTDLSDHATIASVTLPTGGSFAGSLVAAYQVNALRLGTVNTVNGGTAFGVATHKLGSFRGTLSTGSALSLGGPQLKSSTTLAAAVAAQKASLGDFGITLF